MIPATPATGFLAWWDKARPKMEAFANTVKRDVGPVVADLGHWLKDDLLPALGGLGRWLGKYNGYWVPLAAGIAAVAAAVKVANAAVAIFALRLKVATAATALFNLVMDANPIALVALAVVGLGTALVVAYKKSETFRKIVNTGWHLIEVAALAFLSTMLNNVFKPLIDGAARAFGWIPVIGKPLRAAAKAFDSFAKTAQGALDSITGKSVTVKAELAYSAGYNSKFGRAPGQAAGGPVRGPGGPTEDLVPRWLSNGEFVVKAASVRKYGPKFFQELNAGRMAAGGLVVKAQTSLGNAVPQMMLAIQKYAQAHVAQGMAAIGGGGSYGGSYSASGGVARWAPLILQALGLLGQSPSWLPLVERRMNQESGGNPRAINNWDINARHGDPSRGLMQTIGGTFNAYAGPFRGRGIYDPMANIYAGLNYALHRYGSLSALGRPGGYAAGTDHAKPGLAWVGERGPELVDFRGGEHVVPASPEVLAHAARHGDVNITVNVNGAVGEPTAIARKIHAELISLKRRGFQIGLA